MFASVRLFDLNLEIVVRTRVQHGAPWPHIGGFDRAKIGDIELAGEHIGSAGSKRRALRFQQLLLRVEDRDGVTVRGEQLADAKADARRATGHHDNSFIVHDTLSFLGRATGPDPRTSR